MTRRKQPATPQCDTHGSPPPYSPTRAGPNLHHDRARGAFRTSLQATHERTELRFSTSHAGYSSFGGSDLPPDRPLQTSDTPTAKLSQRAHHLLIFSTMLLIALAISVHIYIDFTRTDRWDVRDSIRKEWEYERQQWELEKQRHYQEIEARFRANLRWENVRRVSEACLGYGTREYRAKLVNVPEHIMGGNRRLVMDWCKGTNVTIMNEEEVFPDHCEFLEDNTIIEGHFTVNNDPVCRTLFKSFTDQGCLSIGSGIRVWDAPMENHHYNDRDWDDWQNMCNTTPTILHGVHYPHPTYCTNRGQYGIWGMWEVEDSTCL